MTAYVLMRTDDFDFQLPESLIAQYPLAERTASRLLQLNRHTGAIQHGSFTDIESLLEPGDLLVMNNSKVIAARLYGQKATGGKIELLVERVLAEDRVLAHIKSSKPLKIDQSFTLEDGTLCTVVSRQEGVFELQLTGKSIWAVMDEIGHMPLPPYMEREDEQSDQQRYQTVYAKHEGSVAAPTAGLHFDEALLQRLQDKGVQLDYVMLHVGAGTFQPVRVDDVTQHHMHAEYIEVSPELCERVARTKAAGNKVIAVGTTSVRSLETASQSGTIQPYRGDTDIFIYPGFTFNVIDVMITNFHLPKSTLLMLVSAFASRDAVLAAYQEAVDQQYRFYSYGDAMWIK